MPDDRRTLLLHAVTEADGLLQDRTGERNTVAATWVRKALDLATELGNYHAVFSLTNALEILRGERSGFAASPPGERAEWASNAVSSVRGHLLDEREWASLPPMEFAQRILKSRRRK